LIEPFSPFPSVVSPEAEQGRSALLSPPISLAKHLSPLCPPDVPLKGHGLERERFEMLLQAARQRSQTLGNKRAPDLRREIAVKTHQNKTVERRARFLMKIQQPPSPSATNTPKTPPESPAMFHYSLPSPGLESPLAMYEHLEEECVTSKPWIEQVDFRLKSKPSDNNLRIALSARSTKKGLPSLDQISARMSVRKTTGAASTARLPSFLQQKQQSGKASPPPLSIGRLQMPARLPSPVPEVRVYAAPPSPTTPDLEVTTTLVPRTAPTMRNLTESNLKAFSRAAMLKTLRHRSVSGQDMLTARKENAEDERMRRRRSAPPELPKRERVEFKHGVLNYRGGF